MIEFAQATSHNITIQGLVFPVREIFDEGHALTVVEAGVMNQTMAHAKELAQYGIRVNAIAPGFFIADQNRKLLLNDDGSPTQRGKDVLAHTPMDRFGEPDDLSAAVIFLAAEGSDFVSGITLPIDGAYLCDNI